MNFAEANFPRYVTKFRFGQNDGSTLVASGFLLGFVSLDFGLTVVSCCFLFGSEASYELNATRSRGLI